MIIGYTIDDLGEAAAEQTFSWKINNDESVESVVTTSTRTRFKCPINFPPVWALINLSSSLNKELCAVAEDRGINCSPPVIYEEYNVQQDSINKTIHILQNMMEENTDCKFFMVILPENKDIRDKIYGDLKTLCELEYGIGIVS
ncbi:unnamed protein product [Rotaria sp. Silwood2]|nr:unnamed protein product [Rotaria sp. Silwood2]CAF3293092.1 unnamed protein product [Rotaria sp. Silwood2]